MRSKPFLTVILFTYLSLQAWAGTATVEVNKKADRIDVVVNTTQAVKPNLRMEPGNRFLEVSFPNTRVAAKQTVAVDKGLIRKVTTTQNGSTALVRVYVLSKPKASLNTSGGKKHIYSVSTVTMANAPTRKPETVAARPIERRPVQPVKPVEPVQPEKTEPPQKPTSSPALSGKKVSLTVSNAATSEVLESIAKQAGLKPSISEAVTGDTSVSLIDIPIEIAVETVLGAAKDDFRYEVTATELKVVALRPNNTASVPSVENDGPLVHEYFPFRDKNAREMMEAVRKVVPNVNYQVDDRLNVLLASGTQGDIDRLVKLLQSFSQK